SKGFAMTGWRVGYIGAPKWIADACNKIQGQVTSATCAIAQKATEKALLENPKVVTQKMNETFLKRRDIIVDLLEKIQGIKCNKPEGAFYVFPDVSYYFGKKFNNKTIDNTTELCLYLLNQAHVACVAGDAFGNSECIRISYATSEEKIIEAMKRIKKYLELLS
ncbi:MAG: aspartate aminotransferase, partial [Flavobacteriales bacterium]|nr:aspartate aminotransferase [Flavobacteriales bacterium]